jgi:hypothetical protein
MPWRFRKSRPFGPLRFVLNRSRDRFSFGRDPVRYSLGADGKLRRARRVLGGAYDKVAVLKQEGRDE